MPRSNLFEKMMALIVIMLILIMGLYIYSNRTNANVLRDELHESSRNQLQFFQHQVDTTIQSISLWPNLLLHDPDISALKDIFESQEPYLDLDTITLVKRIQQKISTQENSLNWNSSLMIYSPSLRRVITASDVSSYDHTDLKNRLKQGWQVQRVENESGEDDYVFSLITVTPYSSFHRPENANLIIEVRFNSSDIQRMLDTFKGDGERNPFYYNEQSGIIFNSESDPGMAEEMVGFLNGLPMENSEHQTVEIDGQSYLLNAEVSGTIGWTLVDYLPLAQVMAPIEKSNRLFYCSVAALLLMGIIVAYMLYAQVQVPMRQLVTSFQKLKNEDYSVRLQPKGNSEFSFLFTRFNSMVAQIQDLFGRVYLEKIHVREAKLKQLQSQINPHFIYNCFSFISSMAKLKNYEAIVAMSQNLSHYYRYATRQERELVALSEEMDLLVHYLDIQRMRMKRLSYEVHLPPWLKRQPVPPLVIQPLVENAVLHGVEPSLNAGRVIISADERDGTLTVTVDDDGEGMTEKAIAELMKKLPLPMDEEMSCGLWNVHQRLNLRFGEGAGLTLTRSPLGGLRAALSWQIGDRDSSQEEKA